MKKFLFVIASVLLLGFTADAQNWGVGGRIGADFGLNIKRYMGSNAMEGIIDIHSHGCRLTGLYEWDWKLGNGFHFYAGFGGSLGMWNGDDDDNDDTDFGLSIDGVVGVEWHLPNNIPVTISLDYIPAFELIPNTDLYGKGFALSVKYVW